MKEIMAVIQAGGKGSRLQPYTFVMPKPLMPVGDQPVLEILLKWLRKWGIKKSIIITGYLGHLIRSLCSNGFGNSCGVDISFCQEPEPLGTIGGLRLLDDTLTSTFLTINGDLITDLDLGEFINFHRSNDGLISIAVTPKKVGVDLGVLEAKNGVMTSFKEKPRLEYLVSMGIYCMEPGILELIPKGVPFGFDNLMYAMMQENLPVHVFKHNGLWMDIGREEDFKLAQRDFLKNYKSTILGC